ncbi:fimbriae assembly protein [Acidocella aquatica]|uniref:Fimbriae assembly protein n=1 Tax=Acidocella aquatica TaxID=1922313 RepID=A0ABQ6A6V1_9PROT|nr:cellulose synthase operon protein YhjQ/BcsQ [Acidocella aquatica]GLR67427.1 fimbriae assembly protein [Acidocella aquatica]
MSEAVERNEPVRALELVAFLTDPDSRDLVQSLVFDLELKNVVVRQGGIDDALNFVQTLPSWPHQLLLDIAQSPLPLSDMNRVADIAEPGTRIIVVGDRNDVGLFRDLMQLGVADYLLKPFTPAMLRRGLNFGALASEPVRAPRAGKTLAVIGARGGAGTSTLACSLAWQLAHGFSRRTVVVDLDVYNGAVNLVFNLPPSQGLVSALQNTAGLDHLALEKILTLRGPRLFTLTADVDPRAADPLTPDSLKELLAVLVDHFHFVVLDVPARSGAVVNTLLEQSDFVVMLADPTILAVRNVARILRGREAANTAQRTILVVNNLAPKTPETLTNAAMEAALGRGIDYTLPYTTGLTKSQNLGRPQEFLPAAYSKAVLEIATGITGGGEKQEEQTPSVWKRMFSN